MPNNLKGYDANQVMRSVFDVDLNCLRVCVVDGTPGPGGGVEVIITHTEDSIRLGDGTNFLTSTNNSGKISLDVNVTAPIQITDAGGDALGINPNGSIDVNVITEVSTATIINKYNETTNIASGVETTILTHVATGGKTTYLQKVETAGDCIGKLRIKINGTIIDTKRTSFATDYNTLTQFDGEDNSGYVMTAGQTLTVTVTQTRSAINEFEARASLIEV